MIPGKILNFFELFFKVFSLFFWIYWLSFFSVCKHAVLFLCCIAPLRLRGQGDILSAYMAFSFDCLVSIEHVKGKFLEGFT